MGDLVSISSKKDNEPLITTEPINKNVQSAKHSDAHSETINVKNSDSLPSEHKTDQKTQDKTDEKSKEPIHGQWNECQSADLCEPLQRVLLALKWWSDNSDISNEDILMEYFQTCRSQLINDYHHILDHLNEDIINTNITNQNFNLIYNQITQHKMLCDVQGCEIYRRYNREREQQMKYNNASLEMMVDFFDCLHCYFVHSTDVGYRIINEADFISNHSENPMTALKNYLAPKVKSLNIMRGNNRFANSKFVTAVYENKNDDHKSNNDAADGKEDHAFYCFGKILYNFYFPIDPRNNGYKYATCPGKHTLRSFHTEAFTQFQCDGDMCGRKLKTGYEMHGCRQCKYDLCSECYGVEGKYSSLKEEIISNNTCKLGMKAFNTAYEKAINLKNNSSKIKSMTATIDTYNKNYLPFAKCQELQNIYLRDPSGVQLSLKQILSVILYTDYDTLSYKFSLTFRNGKHIDKEYWIWSLTLIQTVNLFGTLWKNSKMSRLYHGTSVLYFNSFCATFNCPISTTTKLAVATIFAKNDGLVLDLAVADSDDSFLRYFNCSYFSIFGNEDERLFIQPPDFGGNKLEFVSIRNMATDENYKDIIDGLTTFESIITGNKPDVSEAAMNTICELIENNLNDTNHDNTSFIGQIKKNWVNKQKEIRLNIKTLPFYFSFLQKYFVFSNASLYSFDELTVDILCHSLSFDKINIVFKECEVMISDCRERVNSGYLISMLTMLQAINKLSYSKLKEIKLFDIPPISFISPLIKQYESSFKESNWLLKIADSNFPYIRVINMNRLNDVDMKKYMFYV